ncbi:hypothetical protein VitviT2T_002298 [Vitis vinifera]|uniref:Uncharacterized protein n=1 Tax=Vitis vinifera TaxID=29760 RepID=A0ABY9BIY2_VITVI|nr:hypothetical protein VitviT2T_002298 [Vitis vinifera]
MNSSIYETYLMISSGCSQVEKGVPFLVLPVCNHQIVTPLEPFHQYSYELQAGCFSLQYAGQFLPSLSPPQHKVENRREAD